MKPLGVTIDAIPFDYMPYHCVLCYSNREAGMVYFSERHENLGTGLQNALWKLGKVAKYDRADNRTNAVNPAGNGKLLAGNCRGLAER